jgi:hypothetical protein
VSPPYTTLDNSSRRRHGRKSCKPPRPQCPPVGHDGTERHSPCPTDAPAQNTWYSGKKKRQRLKHLLRLNATLRLVFLSGTAPDRVHDKRSADTTSYPLPARSPLLQDLGLSLTVPRYTNGRVCDLNGLQEIIHVSRLSFFTRSCTRSFFVSSLKERNYTYSMYLSTVKVGLGFQGFTL